MYERLRNDFLRSAHEGGMRMEDVQAAVNALDQVAARYEIRQKELALMLYNDELPELVKTYIVCKKIEGLEDRTLETYTRMLRIFFRSFRKPVERIDANDSPKPLVNATCKLGEKGCFKDGRCHALGDCENKIVTNADKIRAMSDKELAAFLAGKFTDHETKKAVQKGEMLGATYVSEMAHTWYAVWMQWLRQPAEVE